MSHELTMNGKVAEMAYVGETPWHGLGQALQLGASMEEWTVAAGMDWKVQRSKVRYFADRDGQQQLEWPENNVLFRSDTKAPLGLVSPKFKIVQPKDVLGFFNDLVADNGFQLETAGTLFGGRRFWALASIGAEAAVLNAADKVGGYLLLCTGVDGTLATTAKFTTVRVVCNNTLSMSLRASKANEIAISHRSKFDPSSVKANLGIAHNKFDVFMHQMRVLAEKQIDVEAVAQLTTQLLRPAVAANATAEEIFQLDTRVASSKNFQNIIQLYNGKGKGSQLLGVANTAWGWVNAVTEHVDFGARTASLDNRLDSAWFGRGADLKTKAVELASAL